MMTRIVLFLGMLLLSPAFLTSPAKAMELGIVAVVNDTMISDLQVRDRMKLIMASSGIPDTPENRSRLLPQVIDMLVYEALKMEAAHKVKVEVSDAEIEQGVAQIAAQNKFTEDQFMQILQAQGIAKRTLEDQIRSEIAWGKYVQQVLRPDVQISEEDIDAELDRLKAENPELAEHPPTRDQVLNKLGNERLGRLQARAIMDLKAGAFIESRG
ncbi:MAG: SurA N-terminal domain-containing protein [Rhodospirillales bacterium]|nr:SurA N-terminal domain-containing protein [Rhodospirillales bacterium]